MTDTIDTIDPMTGEPAPTPTTDGVLSIWPPLENKAWELAVPRLRTAPERIAFARMAIAREGLERCGEAPAITPGLVENRTPEVEAAFAMIREDSENTLAEIRQAIWWAVDTSDPGRLRAEAAGHRAHCEELERLAAAAEAEMAEVPSSAGD